MCGIIGYIGKDKDVSFGIEALKRLEYRGYDSSGIAFFAPEREDIFCVKAAGRIAKLEEKFQDGEVRKGNPLVGHVRWATHGIPNDVNAHPHHDCKKNIFLVHNGIIENFKSLKDHLEHEGHTFYSQTDTEVLCHLIEKFFNGVLEEAVRQALKFVDGTYAIAVIARDDKKKIVVARRSSPLLVGLGEREFIVASDPSAVVSYTKKVVYLEDNEIGVATPEDFRLLTLDKQTVQRPYLELDWSWEEASRGGFAHYMAKEIHEAPEVIENAIRGRIIEEEGTAKLGGLEIIANKLSHINRFIISASGSSYYSSLVGEYMLEEHATLPVEVEHSSELRYRHPVVDDKTCLLTVSQSGETADALAALREFKRKGILCLGMVNVVGSSIARESDAGVYNYAGPEIGVASTKTFISQLTLFAVLTLFFGRQRHLSCGGGKNIVRELKLLPQKAKEILGLADEIKKIAEKYQHFTNFLYIGRKYNFPIALEGALKLKEISYVHAEGYGAGEMKHGPIALIDEHFPTFAIVPSDSVYEKMVSNIMEVKARNGKVIALATQGNQDIEKIADDVIYIPKTLELLTPILTVIPLQLFAYYVGVLRGCDVDKPRNLAKSVTVE
jgi:glucosamine--fructose-6-phosphate aminotransferase (isomerizing)